NKGSGGTTSTTPTPTSSSTNSAPDDHEQSIICVNYVLSAVEFNDVVMDTSQLNGGLVAITPPTPPVISSLNKRNNHSIKRSLSSTPSPESSSMATTHPNSQLSHSQQTSVDHNSHPQHVSHISPAPPPPPPAPQPVVAVTQTNGSTGSS
ncbi:unnamed protein product, partial [Medioppia subpectinata]